MNRYKVVTLLVLMTAIVFLITNLLNTEKKIAYLENQIQQKTDANTELKHLNSQYELAITELQKNLNYYKNNFQENGSYINQYLPEIKNANEYIVNNLKNQSHLLPQIPYSGTFFFGETLLLPNGFCYAYFDDGHTQGVMLLQYSIKNNKISWHKLAEKIL